MGGACYPGDAIERYEVPPERLGRWLERWAEEQRPRRADGDPPRARHVQRRRGAARLRSAVPAARRDAPACATASTRRRCSTTPRRDRVVGVLLVRLGGHAAGVFSGRRLVASKVGQPQRPRPPPRGRVEPEAVRAPPRGPGARGARGGGRRRGARCCSSTGATSRPSCSAATGARWPRCSRIRGCARSSPLVAERVLDVPDPRLAVLRKTPDVFRATILRPR